MDAEEIPGIQFLFEIGNRVVHTVELVVGKWVCQFVLGVKMRYVGKVEKPNTVSESRGDPLRIFRGCLPNRLRNLLQENLNIRLNNQSRFTQCFNLPDRSFHGFRLDWLQQIIDRIHTKCLELVLILCRSKDHDWLAAQLRQDIEAIQARHLNIEEAQDRKSTRLNSSHT